MTLLDCGDVIYDKPSNVSFSNKIELLVALAITRTLKSSSRDKLYQELGLEYLYQRRLIRWLCLPQSPFNRATIT